MKLTAILTTIAAITLAACRYDAPLEAEHTKPIDPAVIGVWIPTQEDGTTATKEERLTILKFSETEYLVHQVSDDASLYYRAYPINPGDVSAIQIEFLGTHKGALEKDQNKNRYDVLKYKITEGTLQISSLNDTLLSRDLKTSDDLREAFLAKKDNENLFSDPQLFHRMEN